MAFITKKHLPRRTFLRGMGVTLALPLLDSMMPAGTALAKTAALPKSRFCGIYVPHGATMDKWTPATEGSGLRVHRDPEAAREAARPHHRRQQPGPSAGRRQGLGRRRRSRALGGGVPERRASREGHACTPARRSTRCWPTRSGRTRRCRRSSCAIEEVALELRRRLRLRLLQHHLLAHADAAAADGEQPAGRLRAAVRRRHQRGAAAVAQAAGPQHPRLGDRQGGAPAARRSTPATARGSASISTTSARSSGASRRREQQSASNLDVPEAPVGMPGGVRGSHQADVRPAGAGLSGGDHPHLDDDVRARYERRGLSRQRRARRVPHRVAPLQRARAHGLVRARSTAITCRCSATSWRSCRPRRTATATCSITRWCSTAAA